MVGVLISYVVEEVVSAHDVSGGLIHGPGWGSDGRIEIMQRVFGWVYTGVEWGEKN
jgi:hypothetical protein